MIKADFTMAGINPAAGNWNGTATQTRGRSSNTPAASSSAANSNAPRSATEVAKDLGKALWKYLGNDDHQRDAAKYPGLSAIQYSVLHHVPTPGVDEGDYDIDDGWPFIEVSGTQVKVGYTVSFDNLIGGISDGLKQLVKDKFPQYYPYVQKGLVTLTGSPRLPGQNYLGRALWLAFGTPQAPEPK